MNESPLEIGQPPRVLGEKPKNHLVMAILSTLCCCLPSGIVAIVFAAQVDGKWAAGDVSGAQDYSEKAKLWGFVSIGLGLVGGLLYGLLVAAGAASSA